MGERLEQLCARVARGDQGAAAELTALLRSDDIQTLRACVTHTSALVRSVAAAALPGRIEVQSAAIARMFAKDREVQVRRALAEAMSDDPHWGDDELYALLLEDPDESVRSMLIERAIEREELLDTLAIAALEDSSMTIRARLCALFADRHPERAVPILIDALATQRDQTVQRAAAVALNAVIKRFKGLPDVVALPKPTIVGLARDALRELAPRQFARLVAVLSERAPESDDDTETESEPAAPAPTTPATPLGPRAFELEPQVEAVLAVLRRPSGRAALLVGPSGAGKTSIVNELARRELQPGVPVRIVRMAPDDFLAGTKYLGEWQTKLEELVASLGQSPGSVLFIPMAHLLTSTGTTIHSDGSLGTALASYIDRGALTVIGETTAEELAAGLGRHSSARRVWTEIRVEAADEARTRRILRALCDEAKTPATEAVLERLYDYSEMFIPAAAQPGRSAALLRGVLEQRPGEALTAPAVLAELRRVTGVPLDLLDDDTPLDPAAVREFFAARVMGQREAIEAITDVVTLFKAGLNDPGKPLAVLLFVGPTGVGKTELARALAERLFGDPARLVRLDMSEYATYEAFERLHGSTHHQGVLTSIVRDRPLSVVLLDEIEKAHSNVFDLCLQIFDAGRLTDGSGRTVDFRRTILIMTSNLGSAVRVDPKLGFGASGVEMPASDDVQRELRSFFRPEFLARIDRVVHFAPLSLESAEQIARRELARMLERRGIERRGLSIDVDPTLVSLLVREGYTQAFGARPLKRTIERRVLLPVARAIAGGRIEPGSVLRLRVDASSEVAVDVVRPVNEHATLEPVAPQAPSEPVRERAQGLLEATERLEALVARWKTRRSELVEASNTPGFWNDASKSAQAMDELHRIDQLLERVSKLSRGARGLSERALRPQGPRSAAQEYDKLVLSAAQLALLARVASTSDASRLGDALIEITSVRRSKAGLDGVQLLARMYRAWAERHGYECETLSDRCGGEPHEDSLVLLVHGAGAHELLRSESGLHTFQQSEGDKRAGEKGARTQREAIRVDVHAVIETRLDAAREGLTTSTRKLSGVRGRQIERPTLEAKVFDAQRARSAVVWSAQPPKKALLHARLLLESRDASSGGGEHVVRRYQLGAAPFVRDMRSKAQSGKLHRVLDGELDEFLALG